MSSKEKRKNNDLKFNDIFENRLEGSNELDKKFSCVYVLKHKQSGEFYIGSSIDGAVRDSRHIQDLRKGVHYNEQLQKNYNDSPNFIFEHNILGNPSNDNIKKLIRNEEQKLLDKSKNNSLLLNKAINSEISFKGLNHTEETKLKMSKAAIGHPVSLLSLQKLAEYNKNRIYTDEDKIKLSLSHKTPIAIERQYQRDKQKMKSVLIDGIKYESITEASKQLNIKLPSLQWRLNSNTKNFENYKKL